MGNILGNLKDFFFRPPKLTDLFFLAGMAAGVGVAAFAGVSLAFGLPMIGAALAGGVVAGALSHVVLPLIAGRPKGPAPLAARPETQQAAREAGRSPVRAKEVSASRPITGGKTRELDASINAVRAAGVGPSTAVSAASIGRMKPGEPLDQNGMPLARPMQQNLLGG